MISAKTVKRNLKKFFGKKVVLKGIYEKFIIWDSDGKNIYLLAEKELTFPKYLNFDGKLELLHKYLIEPKNWENYKNDVVVKALGGPSVEELLSPYKKLGKIVKVNAENGFWTTTLLKANLIFINSNDYIFITEKNDKRIGIRPFLVLGENTKLIKCKGNEVYYMTFN